jgi:hypothetical protein
VNFDLFILHKFKKPVVLCVKLLCGDMEEQPEMSSAVTAPVKLGRLGKSAIKSQNKGTIYNAYKLFMNISVI